MSSPDSPTAPNPSIPSVSTSNTNPHNAHHNIHPLLLAALKLIAPHAIALVVPVRAASTVHAPPAHFLALARGLLCVLALGLAARLRQVLDDRAVDGKLVPAAAGAVFVAVFRGCGLGDQRLQDLLDDAVVPGGGVVVSVAGGGREGGGAGVGGNLGEAGGGDGLFWVRWLVWGAGVTWELRTYECGCGHFGAGGVLFWLLLWWWCA